MILAKTIKGYGLGEGGEGRNVTHNQKKLNEDELREFRTRFGIPISDERRGRGAVLSPARRQPGNELPPRAPQGARRPGAVALDQARDDGSAAARRLRKDDGQAREQRPRQGNVDHDGLRPPAGRPAPRQKDRQAYRADRARRIADVRHGRLVPPGRHLRRTPASSTSRSIPINSRTTRKRKTASCSKKASPRPARCRRSSPPARLTLRTA